MKPNIILTLLASLCLFNLWCKGAIYTAYNGQILPSPDISHRNSRIDPNIDTPILVCTCRPSKVTSCTAVGQPTAWDTWRWLPICSAILLRPSQNWPFVDGLVGWFSARSLTDNIVCGLPVVCDWLSHMYRALTNGFRDRLTWWRFLSPPRRPCLRRV